MQPIVKRFLVLGDRPRFFRSIVFAR